MAGPAASGAGLGARPGGRGAAPALAFGPGHLFASAPPGSAGNSAISGHRDTHFRFLRDLRVGDRIELERRDGARVRYAVYRRSVVHETDSAPLRRQGAQLTLITCYPFDASPPAAATGSWSRRGG
ncbi:MAG: class D sortase [Candidatus Sedimenticola endophacoides]